MSDRTLEAAPSQAQPTTSATPVEFISADNIGTSSSNQAVENVSQNSSHMTELTGTEEIILGSTLVLATLGFVAVTTFLNRNKHHNR